MPLHQTLQAFAGKRPTLGEQTFVAPNASVIGDVTIGNRASVWYGAVLRGETRVPVQEHCICCLQMQLSSCWLVPMTCLSEHHFFFSDFS